MFPIIFFAIFALSSAQRLINLNTLDTYPAENVILASGNASIYITASSDPIDYLDKIVFSTGGLNKTAREVMKSARFYPSTDLLQPWIIQGPVTVTTSLTAEQRRTLTGTIYITTSKQAYDSNFLVFDLTKEQTISISKSRSIIVILNSQNTSSSYFSSWQQTARQQVYMFRGFPPELAANGDSAIFSNPFSTTNSNSQVTNVENFDVNLPIFYFEVYGGVSFKVSTVYVNIAGSKFSNEITTGFYMKSGKTMEADVEIHPITGKSSNILGFNAGFFGIVDMYIGEDIPMSSYVTVGVRPLNNYASEHQFIGSNQSFWQTNVGDPMTIKSTGTNSGQFYIQYYVIEDETSQPIEN